MIEITVNNQVQQLDVEPDTPLLWVVREQLKLNGTKFGCGMAQCGACTVHLNGRAIRSCVTPVAAAAGQSVTTIEGIAEPASDAQSAVLHPVQQAWIDNQVPQCGYCQSGQIMSAVALLETNANPSDDDIDAAMRGNVCRCGMYGRIRNAIKQAASVVQQQLPAAPPAESADDAQGEEVNNG